jgi:DNA-directed RNA polymerase specialized sigma24 family protein
MPDIPAKEGVEPIRAGSFATTHWSVVLQARESSQATEALNKLCLSYWFPLFVFIRRSGYDEELAKDLTQGFFEQFLQKNYLGQVDREKGRFRSFLLGSLKHYLANERDRANAHKRGGHCSFVPWDEDALESQVLHKSLPELPAEKSYERQWALTLLDQVFARLRAECAAAGKSELFEALCSYLSGEKSTDSYADVAARLHMSTGSVQVAVHRLRRRYGELLRIEISHTVSQPGEIDEEIRHLFAALRG